MPPLPRPARLWPLVRHLSRHLTPWLQRLGLSPNQVTSLSLLCGLAGAWCFSAGQPGLDVTGALLFTLCYVLDNCDGELARLTGRSTPFGMVYDTAVDALVHTAVFLGIGHGVELASGSALWWWLGVVAAAGTVINSALALPRDVRSAMAMGRAPPAPAAGAAASGADSPAHTPVTLREHVLYVSRELSRADFCFIVLLLAPLGALWLLLPAAAVGAQAYWLSGLLHGADRFHV